MVCLAALTLTRDAEGEKTHSRLNRRYSTCSLRFVIRSKISKCSVSSCDGPTGVLETERILNSSWKKEKMIISRSRDETQR